MSYRLPELADWWASGKGTNTHTQFTSKNGKLEVYVRRNIADRSVMEIASIVTISGFGSIRPLYRDFCADIPAIAENLLNKELDALLFRWGWTHAWTDLIGTNTRANPEFMRRFPAAPTSYSPIAAIVHSRTT